jgi:predicted permease
LEGKKKTRFRFWLWLITGIGVIVPRRLRADSKQEWEAELRYREELLAGWELLDTRNKFDLFWRSTSAFWDALWLQPQRLEDEMFQDLRYGVRMLLKHKLLTAVAVVSLAFGIGANTAIFHVIDALMLRQLPVAHPEQLISFKEVLSDGFVRPTLTFSKYDRLCGLSDLFSGVLAVAATDRSNVTIDGVVDEGQLRASIVSGNYFSVLGVGASIGRTLTEDDDRIDGGQPVIVLSDGYWQRRFGRRADIVGRTITLNNTAFTIIGVAERGFSGEWVGRLTDVWFPISTLYQVMPEFPAGPRGSRLGYQMIARLRPSISIEQASLAATAVNQQQMIADAGPNPSEQRLQEIASTRFEAEPAARGRSPQRDALAQPLSILMVIVTLVLAVACANIANLLLARSASRRREMAVRAALGARRGRLIRQLLTESLLLSAMGSALGLVFASWMASGLSAFVRSGAVGFNTAPTSINLDLHTDWRILAFTAGLCILTGILFGLIPAFRASRISLSPSLVGRGADSGSSGGRFGVGRSLVVVQVALSLLLMIGAGLFVRTLRNLKTQDLGLDRDHVLLVWTSPMQGGRMGKAASPLFETAQQRISALPGVLSASPSVYGFLNGSPFVGTTVSVPGYEPGPDDPKAQLDIVAPHYFETLGMKLMMGRDFNNHDDEKSTRVVIINEAIARFFFPDQNPIGRHIGFQFTGTPGEIEIVGVVNNAKHITPRDQNRMMFYIPYKQDVSHLLQMCVAVRTAGEPKAVAASVRETLREIDPKLPVIKIDTIGEQLDDLLVQERLITTLATSLGFLGTLLACLGLYGVVSYTVARRTSEIGIRMALGATPANVLRMVLKESLWLVVGGIAAGVPCAIAATKLVSSKLFGVTAADPMTISIGIGLMFSVAMLAALIPAGKASRVDPMTALRHE